MMRAALKRYASFAVWQRPGTAQGRMEVKMNQNELDRARNLCAGMVEDRYSVGEIAQHARRLMPVMLAEIDRLNAEITDADDTVDLMLGEPCTECEELRDEIEQLKKKLALAEAWLAGINSAWSKEDEYWDSVK
jgi:hypothetical protein